MRPWLSIWPPLPPHVYLRRPRRPLPFPFDDGDATLFARARAALWHGLVALGVGAGDAVLVPAYHHGSEVEVFRRLGIECRFYDGNSALTPDPSELEPLVESHVRALHLIHYLGFPQDAPLWRAWCDERGLILIEDAAQAWLANHNGRSVGSDGHLTMYSLYKTFGLPDGGALRSQGLPAPTLSRAPVALRSAIRRHTAWVAQRTRLAPTHVRRSYDREQDIAVGDPAAPPSRVTRFLLPRIAHPDAAAVRRANYAFLLSRLGELVPPPFTTLPDGASPFVFPIHVADKRHVLSVLAARGVIGLDLWSVPHPLLPAAEFPRAASRRARCVGLPVHQELLPRDLETIVRAVGGDDNNQAMSDGVKRRSPRPSS